jgi:hypothetical protein
MSFLDPVTSKLGWRSARMISPHPPDYCRQQLGSSLGRWWSDEEGPIGKVGLRSAALMWNTEDRPVGRLWLLVAMGQPVMRVRFRPQGVGTFLYCQSGVGWVVVGIWATLCAGALLLAAGEGLRAALFLGLMITGLFVLGVVGGHSFARSDEEFLLRFIAQATSAEPV